MTTYDARPSAYTQLTTTTEWEAFMSSAGIQDGIDSANGGSFVPSLDTGGRNAVVSAGQALIKGQLWRADAPVSTSIPAAGAQNRLDRLVLRLNRGATTSPTVVAPTVITGTPSGTPALPPIVQTPTGLYDIPISYWTSGSTGALTALVDQRQYAGRASILMTRAARPVPSAPCIGIETDTGYAYVWNGTNWSYLLQGEQYDGTSYGPLTTVAYARATNLWNIPSNDPIVGTMYKLRFWGTGSWSSSQAAAFNLRGNFTNSSGLGAIPWGATEFSNGTAINWMLESTIIITATGSAGSYVSFNRCDISASGGNLLSTFNSGQASGSATRQGTGAGVLNTTAPMQMWGEISQASTTGGQTATCLGSTFQRTSA